MRLIHFSLKNGRWSYRSMGRTPNKMRAQAALYCTKRNREEGR